MTKTIVRLVTLVQLIVVLVSIPLFAGMREISLEQRIDRSDVIVEGQVVRSTPVYNQERTMISTLHEIQVSKVFKSRGGNPQRLTEIEVTTPGGRIGNDWHVVQPALTLVPGDAGIFFLEARAVSPGKPRIHLPYASTQGFVKYLEGGAEGRDPFHVYSDVLLELHQPIGRQLATDARIVRPDAPWQGRSSLVEPEPEGASAAAGVIAITNLSPMQVVAGVQDVLTITGSSFGTLSGLATVFFDDANDGQGGNAGGVDPEHIISWSDTVIEVRVPYRFNAFPAGTGTVTVRDAAGQTADSPMVLTVLYALAEALTDEPAVRRISLENENFIGGYTYQFGTSTANNGVDITSVAGATDRFLEALDAWNCQADWNVGQFGTTTVNATGNDGVNIVAFDNSVDALPAGVLGRATNFYSSCGGNTWSVNGIDIRFKRDGTGAVWYYGADPGSQGPGQDDFMSVALHELGHSVQHGHINDMNDVMYFALTRGDNMRTLSPENITGGMDIVAFSTGYASCSKTGMFALDCLAAPTADFTGAPLGACGSSVTVSFEDRSLNAPTSWFWNLGDTSSSSERNPSHDYNGQGLYSVSLEATNGNGSDTRLRSGFVVLTDAPLAPACTPPSVDHNNCCQTGILNVSLNNINLSTDTPTEGDPIYEDFTCSQFTVLEPGETYDVSVTTGPANSENVRVYVDWNNDGTLAPGEIAFESLNTTGEHVGMITVPGGAVEDTALRMRAISEFGLAVSSPCENLDFGQAEDYSVVVAAPAPQPPVVEPGSAVAVCGTTAHYAWVAFDEGGTNPNIGYRNCTFGGGCSSVQRLVGAATEEFNPNVVCSGSTVMVAWEDLRNGNRDIFYRRSTNGGTTFSGLQGLVSASTDERDLALIMDGMTVIAAWADLRKGNSHIALKRSTDGGASFGPIQFVVSAPTAETFPVMAKDGMDLLVAWEDARRGNQHVGYKQSTDGGVSFGPIKFLVSSPVDETRPVVGRNGGVIVAAWEDPRRGNLNIFSRKSLDGGNTWDALFAVVSATTEERNPLLAMDGNLLLIGWEDRRAINSHIAYRRSTDGGVSYDPLQFLVSAPTDETHPACDISGALVACIWSDNRTGEPRPMARESQDSAATWSGLRALDP